MRVAFCQPAVAGCLHLIDEKGAPLLNCIYGDGRIAGVPADATKRPRPNLIGIRLCSGKFTVGRTRPKVRAAGMEKSSSESTKGTNELAGIIALKSSAGKL
jgi:hypothetical protein